MGWIKCSEELPDDESWVIATDGKHRFVGAYLLYDHLKDNERWQDMNFEAIEIRCRRKVTHWMRYPELPED